MKKELFTFTLEELLNGNIGFGLAKTSLDVANVKEQAKPKNDFFIGTNVYEWLNRFTYFTEECLIENLSQFDDDGHIIEGSHLKHVFTEISHDNTYNWSGLSNTDIDYRILQDEYGNCYAYVNIHIGGDPRGGYTEGILLNLETENTENAFLFFIEDLYECGNSGYVEYQGRQFYLDGEILGEYIRVSEHGGEFDAEICDAVYCYNEEEFQKECLEIVKQALKEEEE